MTRESRNTTMFDLSEDAEPIAPVVEEVVVEEVVVVSPVVANTGEPLNFTMENDYLTFNVSGVSYVADPTFVQTFVLAYYGKEGPGTYTPTEFGGFSVTVTAKDAATT